MGTLGTDPQSRRNNVKTRGQPMATVQLGDTLTEISGSRGGSTYSRNQYGLHVKHKRGPTTQRSTRQQARKPVFSYLTHYWTTDLSQPERDAWNVYARLTPIENRLGRTIHLSGFNLFLRTNILKRLGASAILDTAPPTRGLAYQLIPYRQFYLWERTQTYYFRHRSFRNYDHLTLHNDVVAYGTPGSSTQTPNVRLKLIRYCGTMKGDPGNPTPYTIASKYPYPIIKDLYYWLAFAHINPDGKVSPKSWIQWKAVWT